MKTENVRKVDENKFEIQSHTNKNTWYKVDLVSGSCSCPHWRIRLARFGGKCKHYNDLINYFEDVKDNRQTDFDKIIQLVNETDNCGFMDVVEAGFKDEIIDEMIQLGMLLEQKGKLMVLK